MDASPSISSVLDLTSAALDRQTAALTAGLERLSSALANGSSSSGLLTAVLRGLHDLGLTKDRAGRALDGLHRMEDRVVQLEAEGRALRKDVR